MSRDQPLFSAFCPLEQQRVKQQRSSRGSTIDTKRFRDTAIRALTVELATQRSVISGQGTSGQ